MAGTLRAEATLGLANGAYLILLLTGGIFLPLGHLPAPIAAVSPFLPAAPLADLLDPRSAGATCRCSASSSSSSGPSRRMDWPR